MTRYEFRYARFRGSTFPIMPLQLRASKGPWIATTALVDSGASISLFDGDVARALGVRVRSGRDVHPAGIGGQIAAHVHRIALKIGDEEFDANVAFTSDEGCQSTC